MKGKTFTPEGEVAVEKSVPIPVKDLLKKVPLFAEMADDDLTSLKEIVHVKKFPKGTVLFEEGDEGQELFVILKGLLKISVIHEDGREFTLIISRPYDCLGEIALLDGSPRSAGATALEDVEVLSIRKSDFDQVINRHSKLKDSIIKLLCWRLRNLTDEVTDFAFLNVYYRLSKKLLELADTFGVESPEGIVINRKITHQELANMVATSREMITKIINEMKKEKVLALQQHRMVIPQRGKTVLLRASTILDKH
ncbi:MAG: Crp/Fnr family transcriptional regulator [Candidatus Eremiobacteraeota bacterium]|nr:Crp/Fnr family transcriptional regulator [Candidatus Eremiobacteraeota bacterium]